MNEQYRALCESCPFEHTRSLQQEIFDILTEISKLITPVELDGSHVNVSSSSLSRHGHT